MTATRESDVAAPLWILAVIALAMFLRQSRALFLPVALAALLSFALAPAVRGLRSLRLGRWLSASLVVGVLAAATAWGVYTVGDRTAEAVADLPQQAREVRERMQASSGSLFERISRAADEIRQIGHSRDASQKQP